MTENKTTLSFEEAVAAESARPTKGPACAIRRFYNGVLTDKNQRAKFENLLHEVVAGERTQASVHRIMAHMGHRVDPRAVSNHNSGGCNCKRDPDGHVFWDQS